MNRRIVVTSALPYANGSIHIGHLVEYIQTDIHVRYLKLKGADAIYCCADDTHGTPIEINAKKAGVPPEKFIEKFHEEHKQDFASFFIEFDSYYSTNSEENRQYAEQIFNALKKKGDIYTKDVELTYCEHCGRFLPDRYVKGQCPKCGAEDQYGDVCEKCNAAYTTIELKEPFCVVCRNPPTRKTSKHYFFRLSNYSDFLRDWLTSNKKLQPEIRNQFVRWIDEGLNDWDISRDGPYFGFRIPGEENKYFYVWLDAPIGYISSTANYCKGKDLTAEDYWKKDAEIIHFIGKDITYFHLLFWPAILKGSGFNIPDDVVVHGFLTVNREKMSKSRGTFLTAKEFLKVGDPEHLRYYYAGNLTHTMTDIDLDLKDYTDRINNELVANIANFAYRCLSFINKNFDSKVGETEKDEALIKKLNDLYKKVDLHYSNYDLRYALREILSVADIGNRYFQEKEPWKLVKEDKEAARKVLALCLNMLKNLTVLIKPILPRFASELEKQMGTMDLSWVDINFSLEDHKIGRAEILFNKIEQLAFGKEKEGFLLNLKIGKVLSVEDHPDADKLYVLKVDLGEKRQLVAGLKEHYTKDELLGKHLVVVFNLEPAKLRGVKSEGMLLAADDGKKVGVLQAPNSSPGDQVKALDVPPNEKKISFKQFTEIKLKAKAGKAFYKDHVLRTGKEEISLDRIDEGKIR